MTYAWMPSTWLRASSKGSNCFFSSGSSSSGWSMRGWIQGQPTSADNAQESFKEQRKKARFRSKWFLLLTNPLTLTSTLIHHDPVSTTHYPVSHGTRSSPVEASARQISELQSISPRAGCSHSPPSGTALLAKLRSNASLPLPRKKALAPCPWQIPQTWCLLPPVAGPAAGRIGDDLRHVKVGVIMESINIREAEPTDLGHVSPPMIDSKTNNLKPQSQSVKAAVVDLKLRYLKDSPYWCAPSAWHTSRQHIWMKHGTMTPPPASALCPSHQHCASSLSEA